jgi:eukaryotic-like serine/threonine-protein kinase
VTPEQWKNVKEVLASALERPPEERTAFLEQACDATEMRREVESLIEAYETHSAEFSARQAPGTGGLLKPGARLGPYLILAPLGAGGMGIVYCARDERLERDVAIKVLPPHTFVDESSRKRFRQEALALAKVNHPNIAAIYDVGGADGADYLVMEYVPGQSIAQRTKTGPIGVPEALALGHEIALALEEAHEQGIVHRDLKPANVIVTPRGHAKILDFGLAKLLGAAQDDDAPTISQTQGIVGTPLYMSPEQAEGRPADARADLWGLGSILYQTLTGQAPFEGNTGLALLRAITQMPPKPVREIRPQVPEGVEAIISRALEKDAAKRYQSAAEMSRDLSAAIARLTSPHIAPPEGELRVSFKYAIPAALAVVALAVLGGWLYRRSERRHWAREDAIPKIAQLQGADKPLAAFALLQQAERYLPGDAQVAQIASESTIQATITSTPPGATVEIQDYLSPQSAWYRLGATPLNGVAIPKGYFRWKVSKDGVGEYVAAPFTNKEMDFALDSEVASPPGMSWVHGGPWGEYVGFVGLVGPYNLPSFYIDRYEVTNRQYQEFVDRGGYEKPQYWSSQFVTHEGHVLTWDEVKTQFHDTTGRPGPSTWAGGHYAEGQADFPVSGVSWYEASAYAAFIGKSLPTFAQWYEAADPDATRYIVQESNYSQSKLAPVGSYPGLGIYGTYDMAGNVREWIENDAGDNTKFALGGAWLSPPYTYSDATAAPLLDRSPDNGIRLVKNPAPLPSQITAAIPALHRDFSKYKPASDDVYRAYKVLYTYDQTPLNAKSEGIVQETTDWREEKVTFDAGYNGERMMAYLFLPKNVHPPFQTVLFSPSARVLSLRDSSHLGDIQFFDYIVQSGRAVAYPILKGTYERQQKVTAPGAAQDVTYMTERYKDIARTLDYLETRPDIDKSKFAYLGVSMGSAEGVVYAALAQERFKAVILLDGGYFLNPQPTGTDAADFAPRLKKPVLMVNGQDDYVFTVDKSQMPLFRMLGTPTADKRHTVLDTAHDVTERHPQLVSEVLGWLDKYLGRVN